MDIATYGHNELIAKSELESWRFDAFFSPVSFDAVGFPTRIAHVGQIRGLLAGMHSRDRIQPFMEELSGLQDDDLNRLSRAIARYMRWYRTVFPDEAVPVPVADFVSQYLAYLKLRGLPRRRVLEIGPGFGLIAFFMCDDEGVESYDQIEITQSFFVIQALIGSNCYGEAFHNAALNVGAASKVGRLAETRPVLNAARPYVISMPRSFRCSLYPWWNLDVPLSGQYDVIASHANLVEMSAASLEYYLERWSKVLSDTGYVLIQDLGHAVRRSHDHVLKAIDAAGFRALAKFRGRHGRAFATYWNLLLVTERHPDYGPAMSVLEPQVLLDDHETVRRVFGLDRPDGRKLTPKDILGHVSSRLAQPNRAQPNRAQPNRA